MNEKGIHISAALNAFHNAYVKSSYVIAHNMKFDSEMIRLEVMRNKNLLERRYSIVSDKILNKIYERDNNIERVCTMMRSIDVCNILCMSNKTNGPLSSYEMMVNVNVNGMTQEKRMYKKFPTLAELHIELFGTIPEGLHDSLVDVYVCLRCYTELQKLRMVRSETTE
jgi:DNA polymerase III epsilon subunit-like protein